MLAADGLLLLSEHINTLLNEHRTIIATIVEVFTQLHYVFAIHCLILFLLYIMRILYCIVLFNFTVSR